MIIAGVLLVMGFGLYTLLKPFSEPHVKPQRKDRLPELTLSNIPAAEYANAQAHFQRED